MSNYRKMIEARDFINEANMLTTASSPIPKKHFKG